jgi:hypothetical protein
MPGGRIPPLAIEQWNKVKTELVSTIQKAKGPTIDAAYKKELAKRVQALFTQFDSGLKATMKKANDAKTDADAKKALADVVKISTDYMNKLTAAQKQWGENGLGAAEIIEKNLKRIKESAETVLKSIR